MNVYIKNFGEDLDDDKLREMFEKYGKITSAKVMVDETGKSKGFGFVSFEDTVDAKKAVIGLNNKELNGKILYVGRAQKKSERATILKGNFEHPTMYGIKQHQGVNLYVKNLDDSIDDERLEEEFTAFGTITSAKVMTFPNGLSKGFGFVCFSAPEEAATAITEMNGRIVSSRPLYVALAQRKEERERYLASQYMHGTAGIRMQLLNSANAGYFVPTMAEVQQEFYTQMAEMPWTINTQMRPGA